MPESRTKLGRREMQVYSLLVAGLTAKQIAAAMHLSLARVYEILHDICVKRGVEDIHELLMQYHREKDAERLRSDPVLRLILPHIKDGGGRRRK